MTVLAQAPAGIDDRLARRNALVLAAAQALAGANSAVVFGTAGLVGTMLAPDPALATVPVSTFVVGQWIGTLPVGAIARRFGRLVTFELGTLIGLCAGLVCAAGVILASFPLFCFGTLCGGLYAAAHLTYRFAAADTASDAFKPKAVSWVLAGGVMAGVFGPQLIIATKDVLPQYVFAASYLAQAAVAVVAALVLLLVRFPDHAAGPARAAAPPRPLAVIFRQPRLITAVLCGLASYATMNLMMTAAPVAMVACNHSVTDAALGLQWHVMAMYAPSFVTGSLIVRFGTARVIAAGLALTGLSAAVGWAGTSVAHFWTALILLGVGWNFAFVGATALVTACHTASERNKVQAVNDFFIFGTMAAGSFASGHMLARHGWPLVVEVVLGAVVATVALLAWIALAGRRRSVPDA
ncbi:MFS transporter [Rhodoplanes sp. TEM]|uniref:MFS transporter n=1 Tax=Rhodoplanes tepidamans TaxID=200616 RepID=A0ABT5JH70_RHOTP|nr:MULTISPECIES: MFS transporter [Rhodoplanes]MDC7788843.1 MFS transporter [Rhodoplanes tepidamans]MDC7986492.1 MFS transporter [Rhodoplanes sp. TEM]MDQ0357485.1 MFS family permease [Rhodoplanes tepidamans]